MKKYAILFLVGKDRPGIVEEISTFLFERGANLEDSRMAAMGGRFSVMTLFSATADQFAGIESSLASLRKLGFDVSIHEADDPAVLSRTAELPLEFEITAMDHPGIVKSVVHALHQYGINIHALETRVSSAPLSGSPLFGLMIQAGVPEGVSVGRVKKELASLAEDLNMDLNFF